MTDAPETGSLGSPVDLSTYGTGPAIVLVHALGGDRQVGRLLAGLCPDFSVVSYDLPGHEGRPAPPGPYTVGDLAAELAAALAEAGIGPAWLVGMSLGGLVVQEFAAAFPDQAAGLVLADTVARYPEPVRAMWTDRACAVRATGLTPQIEPTLAMWFTDEYVQSGGPQVDMTRASLRAASPEGYALACEALRVADTNERLAAIAAPTLVVCGDADQPHFTAAATRFTEVIPGAELCWLLPARHAAILEHPEQFAAALRSFVAAHPMSGSAA